MKRLDDKIREAFEALEATVPDGYFDEFASRVDARLEEQAMNGTDMSEVKGDNDREIPPTMAAEDSKETWEDDEHSGVAEIAELANMTKSRLSRRATTQSEAESAMLLSASHSGLSAVVLPEPGKGGQKFDDADEPVAKQKGKAKAKAKATAAAATGGAVALEQEERRGMPVWIYGAVALVAAAAVVFFVVRGGGKSDSGDTKQNVAKNDMNRAGGTPPAPGATPPTTKSPDDNAVTAADPNKEDDGANKDSAKSDTADGTGGKADPTTTTTDADTKNDDSPKVAVNAPAKTAKKAPRRTARNTAPARKRVATTKGKTTKTSAPKRTRSNKPKKDQSVEDLLGQFDEKKGTKKVTKKAAAKPTKKTLSRSDVKRGMRGVAGRVQGCYNAHKKEGLVMINVRVNGDGKVSASASGSFAGTPTGKCVAAAVRRARFPKFSGAPMSFPYPFRLNP